MSHRYRLALALALVVAVAMPAAAQAAARGIQVRAACYQGADAERRVLADLSCESAMACWGDPGSVTLLDAESGEAMGAGAGELAYVDGAGNVLAEPPMQGTIRAVWSLALEPAAAPKQVQVAVDGVAATDAFEPGADCAALPAAAVKRLSGG